MRFLLEVYNLIQTIFTTFYVYNITYLCIFENLPIWILNTIDILFFVKYRCTVIHILQCTFYVILHSNSTYYLLINYYLSLDIFNK